MKLVFLIREGQTFIYQLNKGSGSQIFAIDNDINSKQAIR